MNSYTNPFDSSQFGAGESVGLTKLWISEICVAIVIKLVTRFFQIKFEINWLPSLANTLFWIAFPIAALSLTFGHAIYYSKLNIGALFYSSVAIDLAFRAVIAAVLALIATKRPNKLVCRLGIADILRMNCHK